MIKIETDNYRFVIKKKSQLSVIPLVEQFAGYAEIKEKPTSFFDKTIKIPEDKRFGFLEKVSEVGMYSWSPHNKYVMLYNVGVGRELEFEYTDHSKWDPRRTTIVVGTVRKMEIDPFLLPETQEGLRKKPAIEIIRKEEQHILIRDGKDLGEIKYFDDIFYNGFRVGNINNPDCRTSHLQIWRHNFTWDPSK